MKNPSRKRSLFSKFETCNVDIILIQLTHSPNSSPADFPRGYFTVCIDVHVHLESASIERSLMVV